MDNKKTFQVFSPVYKNRFIIRIKSGDGNSLRAWHALSFSEIADKKTLYVSYKDFCGEEYSVEDFFLDRLTHKPKRLVPKNKKLTVTIDYLGWDLRINRTHTYNNVVVREASITDFDYGINGQQKICATLEYGEKLIQTWPVAIESDVANRVFGGNSIGETQRENVTIDYKDYADRVMEAQQNMLQDARESVIMFGKSNKWTKEQLDNSIGLVDGCIAENNSMSEPLSEENLTPAQKSRLLLYETRTKILENAKKDNWSSDEINHAIKMIDRLLTRSYNSEDFDIKEELNINGDTEKTTDA